jgi:hypothetical protein
VDESAYLRAGANRLLAERHVFLLSSAWLRKRVEAQEAKKLRPFESLTRHHVYLTTLLISPVLGARCP